MNKTILILSIITICLINSSVSSNLRVLPSYHGLPNSTVTNNTTTVVNTTNTTLPNNSTNTTVSNNSTNTTIPNNTTTVVNSTNTTLPNNSTNTTISNNSTNTTVTNNTLPGNSTNTTNTTNTTVTANATFISECLDYQNTFRQNVGSPNLTWSADLAAGAQAWAQSMADANSLTHSHSGGAYGENIAMGTTRTHTLQSLFKLWTNEIQYFIPGVKFPNCSTGGTVGHYTQVVWAKTTQVGCGVGYNGSNTYLCCRYVRPGNYINQFVY